MKNIYIVFFLALVLASCNRDDLNEVDKTVIIIPPNEVVNGSVSGIVYGGEGVPLVDAVVTLGEEEFTTTDAQGKFDFIDVAIFEDGTYVQVEKEGYLSGSRKFLAIGDAFHQVKIQLIKKEGDIFNTEDNTADARDFNVGSALVSLPAGSYQKEGVEHNGLVNVYAKWLDPSRRETFYTMPGNLTGIDTNGLFKVLTTFGMMRVELEDEEGKQVDLPEGKTATLHFPIPEIMEQYNPPAQLSLWHFDEDNGIWRQEGAAQLVDDHYIAEVSHFSYWNLSIASEKVLISGTVTLDGMIMGNKDIIIKDLDSGYLVRGVTSALGTFSETVPRGNRLLVEVPTDCYYEPYAAEFDGYSVDQADIYWNLESQADGLLVEGVIVDCNDEPIPFGMIRYNIGNHNEIHRADDQARFRIQESDCLQESFSLYAIDPFGSQISERQNISNSNFDLGNISACGDSDIHYNLDYEGMDWRAELDQRGEHNWELNKIGANIILIHSTITIDGDKHFDGVFKFNLLDADAQGKIEDVEYAIGITTATLDAEIGGRCEIIEKDNGTYKTYTISGENNSQSNLGTVIFDLVYFD